jgi:hypothetical protein
LEVSAAASDEMAQLDQLMRQELARFMPVMPRLIADQTPVDQAGRARAEHNILSRLQGLPFVNNSSTFGTQRQQAVQSNPIQSVMFLLVSLFVIVYVVGKLFNWW